MDLKLGGTEVCFWFERSPGSRWEGRASNRKLGEVGRRNRQHSAGGDIKEGRCGKQREGQALGPSFQLDERKLPPPIYTKR